MVSKDYKALGIYKDFVHIAFHMLQWWFPQITKFLVFERILCTLLSTCYNDGFQRLQRPWHLQGFCAHCFPHVTMMASKDYKVFCFHVGKATLDELNLWIP